MKKYEPHSSSLGGASANLVAMLGAVLPFLFSLPGIAVSLLLGYTEKKSGLVKHYAFMASILCATRFVLNRIFGGGLAWVAINLGTAALIGLSVYYAYQWREWDTPIFGRWGGKLRARFTKAAYEWDGPVPPGCGQGSGSAFCALSSKDTDDEAASETQPQLPEMRATVIDAGELADDEKVKISVGCKADGMPACARTACMQPDAEHTPVDTVNATDDEQRNLDPAEAEEPELPVPEYLLPYMGMPPAPDPPPPPRLPELNSEKRPNE